MKTKLFTYVITSLAATLLAMGAQAETRLNHAAQFCNKTGSDGSLVRYWQGTIGNGSSSKNLRVLCPMVRVSGVSSTGRINVHTIDRNQSKGIDCGFYDQRAYGHDWTWSGWKTSVGSGVNNFRTFSFGPYASQDRYSGFHHVHCVLPPRSSSYGNSILASYSSGDT